MRESARILGQRFGVTSQEMNMILKELGYLVGGPGAWEVTEKGAKYAFEKDHHRGAGGSPWYNRDWTTTSWDGSIVDELNIPYDLRRRAQEAVSAARAAKRAATTVADHIAANADVMADNSANATGNGKRVAIAATGIVALAGSAYGIYKAAPHAKKLLNEKVVPGLKTIRDKVLRKSDKDPGSEQDAADALSGGVEADQAG